MFRVILDREPMLVFDRANAVKPVLAALEVRTVQENVDAKERSKEIRIVSRDSTERAVNKHFY